MPKMGMTLRRPGRDCCPILDAVEKKYRPVRSSYPRDTAVDISQDLSVRPFVLAPIPELKAPLPHEI